MKKAYVRKLDGATLVITEDGQKAVVPAKSLCDLAAKLMLELYWEDKTPVECKDRLSR